MLGARGNRKRISDIKLNRPSEKKSQHGYTIRNQNLKALGFNSYKHYLNSQMWLEIRKLAFAKHGTHCFKCGQHATELHHSSYDLKTLSGATLEFIHPICRECHLAAEVDENGKVHFVDANRSLSLPVPRISMSDREQSNQFLNETTKSQCIKRPSESRPAKPCKTCGKLASPLSPLGDCQQCKQKDAKRRRLKQKLDKILKALHDVDTN